MHEQFKTSLITELHKNAEKISHVKTDLAKHMEAYMSTFKRNEFHMTKTDGEIKNCEKKLETYKAYIDGKIEAMEYECSRKCFIDDLK